MLNIWVVVGGVIFGLSIFFSSYYPAASVESQPSPAKLQSPIALTGAIVAPYDGTSIAINPYNILEQLRYSAQIGPFIGTSDLSIAAQFPFLQFYPHQDQYQLQYGDPLSPTQSLPQEDLFLQEGNIVDIIPPETSIISVMDGNNASLQEGGMTTSQVAVLTIQATDDNAVTGLQCSLDNLQYDPLVCVSNPVIIENLEPGTHFFQTSSVDSAGNIDVTPAIFSWTVAPGNQLSGDQQIPEQFQLQLPQYQFHPQLSQYQEQQYFQPYLMPVAPLANVVPNENVTFLSEQQLLTQTPTTTNNPYSPYPLDDVFQSPFDNRQEQQYNSRVEQQSSQLPLQNITEAREPQGILSLFPFQTHPFNFSRSNESYQTLNLTSTLRADPITDMLQNSTVRSATFNNNTLFPTKMNTTTQAPPPTVSPPISNTSNPSILAFDTGKNGRSNLTAPADNSEITPAATPTLNDPALRAQTIATGLNRPTSMAFLGPSDILILEKNTGMVKRIKGTTILPQPLLDLNVAAESERGLLGIDVFKISSSQYYVFLYYTQSTQDGGPPIANRLYRYLLTIGPSAGPAQGMMTSPKLLLNLPATPGPNHDGGKVVISPGGDVYAVLGDLNRNGKAQNFAEGANPDATSGILRVTRDGNIVGSGILGSANPLNKYYAYGIRNSFGIDFDPVTGRLWDTENGPALNDEINLVSPGFNSGWEDLMGMARPSFDFNNLVNLGGKGVYSNPEFVWREPVAPTAIEFFNSVRLGSQYQNDMFVGDFNKGRLYNFNLNSQRNALVLTGALADKVANTDAETQTVIFGQGFGGISDLKVGAVDGYLYVLSIGNGAIYRIIPRA